VTLLIRPALPSDADQVATLFAQFDHPTDAASLPDRLARFTADGGRTAIVATIGTTVVGVATAHVYVTLHNEAPAVMLTALVVRDTDRGRGAGRRLVDAISDWARQQGAARLVVTTALRRAGAHAFYERLGFEQTGRRYQRLTII
jgi:GNAT superfamily N-acetyltransferase